MGRATQGVKLINLKGNDSIAAVAKVMREEEDSLIEEALDESIDNQDANEDGTTLDNTDDENNN